MPKVAFHLCRPEVESSCVVFASPHSGRDYPWSFLRHTLLDEHAIRSLRRCLCRSAVRLRAAIRCAAAQGGAPRAFVDLNRSCDELDPALIEGVRRSGHNPRVASGLGVVPRVVANGRAIYRGKLPMAEVERRIDQYWRPYHRQMQQLLDRAHMRFGEAILVDCHSMPHEAVDGIVRGGARRPDIVIGDRFGASACALVVDRIEAAFADAGLAVARNAPFAGAYMTQAYGRPSRNQHAIQIEIDRGIYMNEAMIQPSANFHAFRRVLRGVIAAISSIGPDERRLAAE